MPMRQRVRRALAFTGSIAVLSNGKQPKDATIHYEWRVSEWSPCSDSCGFGMQKRSVECMSIMTNTFNMHVAQPASDPSKCSEGKWLGFPGTRQRPPEAERKCIGRVPPISYCIHCPVADDDARQPVCRECAPGFNVTDDGRCTNSADQVLIDLSTRVRPTTQWQQEWRPKLGRCLASLAHNISLHNVSIYSVVSADMPHSLKPEDIVGAHDAVNEPGDKAHAPHEHRLRSGPWKQDIVDDLELTSNTAIFRAAVPVPEGVVASQFRRDLHGAVKATVADIEAGGMNPATCPSAALGLEGSAVLRANAIMAHTHGCYEDYHGPLLDPEHGGFSVFAWIGIFLGIVGVCWLAYIPVERTEAVRSRRRRANLVPGAISSDVQLGKV
mmetsp:Transcript_127440/g.366550  ORF Transcript_127440/g.366550 Transcript_127440/m.366550 type:complete len:384 (+) Transcript_127440:63-1214(+)